LSKFKTEGSGLGDPEKLETAWQDRLDDARSLAKSGRPGMASACIFYAIEIKLKSMICRKLDFDRLPKEFEIHDLRGLLTVAGLSRRIKEKAGVSRNWERICNRSESLNDYRYHPNHGYSEAQVQELLSLLEDPEEGVLAWLSSIQ
jgi:HEPN domain-containing protein